MGWILAGLAAWLLTKSGADSRETELPGAPPSAPGQPTAEDVAAAWAGRFREIRADVLSNRPNLG